MKILLQNTMSGLIPLYPSDYNEKKKLKIGDTYEADIKRPRNVAFHRKFFSLINLGHQNTSLEMPFETYRKYIIMKAGFFNAYDTPKGTLIEAQSISFSSMSEDVFSDLYSRSLDVVVRDIGSTTKEVEMSLVEYM